MARDYLATTGGEYGPADLPRIWNAQRRAEDAAAALRPELLICDTGPFVIRVWSEVKYGYCDPAILRATHNRHYDRIILCAPDIPWVPDPLRETPDEGERWRLFERYRELLPWAEVYKR